MYIEFFYAYFFPQGHEFIVKFSNISLISTTTVCTTYMYKNAMQFIIKFPYMIISKNMQHYNTPSC